MKTLELVRIGLMGALGLGVVATIFAPLPIGGMGRVPVVGVSALYLPLLFPVIILLLVAVSFAMADSEIRVEKPTTAHASRRGPENGAMSTEYDGRDPIEILKQQYTDDEITHAEYEQRLGILLDADDADELTDRLDRPTDETSGSRGL